MNWFERHLNWSLLLGLFYVPVNIALTINTITGIFIVIAGLLAYGFSEGLVEHLTNLAEQQAAQSTGWKVYGIVLLLLTVVGAIMVTVWYLSRKDRSKAFVLLLIAPPIIGFLSIFMGFMGSPIVMIGGIIIALVGPIIGLIILLLLKNQNLGYGGDFVSRPTIDSWSDTGQYGTPDTWQPPKPLDYSPAKNVNDIAFGGGVGIPGGKGPAGAIEEVFATDAEVKATEPAGSQYMSSAPILLDDAGAAIKCFYHPDADAVNSCSRCGQYVCSQCNYVTGTHPICHNCWGKPAGRPIAAAPARKQEIPKVVKSEKPGESSISATPDVPAIPATSATPEVSAMPPVADIPTTSVPPALSAIPAASAIPITPEVPTVSAVPEIPVQQQETQKLTKSDRRQIEDYERSRQFMMLYEQALPFIGAVIARSPEGLPASPLDMMEGLKLSPMLKYAKELPKPREKELQEAKKVFEQLLEVCIKVGGKAADFVSSSGQVIPTEANYARLTDGLEKARGLMDKLFTKLPPSQPQA